MQKLDTIESLLPNDDILIKNDRKWKDIISVRLSLNEVYENLSLLLKFQKAERHSVDDTGDDGISLDDLEAVCSVIDSENSDDEYFPQCEEVVDYPATSEKFSKSSTSMDPLEERRLVLKGKAPHFQHEFLQNLRTLINRRLKNLKDQNILLSFSGSERIKFHEKLEVIKVFIFKSIEI